MAHELTPKPERPPLPIEEIIRRLNDSFDHVELDVEQASRDLQSGVRYMARTGAPHFDNEDIERARRSIGHSVCVVLADDANPGLAYVSFLLEPEHERIFISYESGNHEDASRELMVRLARVLDYEMELVSESPLCAAFGPRNQCATHRSGDVRVAPAPTMWSPAHVIAELSIVLGLGATGAGIIQLRHTEGRITLAVGISLLLCCAAVGGFS